MFTLIGLRSVRLAGVSAGRAGDIRQESTGAGHHGPGQGARGAGQGAGGPAQARAGLCRRAGMYSVMLPSRRAFGEWCPSINGNVWSIWEVQYL